MIVFFYNLIVIPIIQLLVLCISQFNTKLKEREKAWKTTLLTLEKLPQNTKRIWFHAASLGEFEQAKPIIERLKSQNQNLSIIVSFYSPSGYRNVKEYPQADAIVYMPIDTRRKAKQFIEMMNPNVAVFIRYELWLNHLNILSNKNISTFLFCATFPNAKIWKLIFLHQFLSAILNNFTGIYTVSDFETHSFKQLLLDIPVTTSRDTRFDRIISVVETVKDSKKILPESYYKSNELILVAGSTWQKDEEIIIDSLEQIEKKGYGIRPIIVPHEPTREHCMNLKSKFQESVFLSELNSQSDNFKFIIVDSIGKLLLLYGVADIVYVGGGFGSGVHSTAEPAAYGVPIVCGRNISRSPDAQNLEQLGALTCINSSENLSKWLENMITNPSERISRGEIAKQYVYNGAGGSKTCADIIEKSM